MGEKDPDNNSDKLQKLVHEFADMDWCSENWGGLDEGMVCTGADAENGPDERHIWVGDSGSPLFRKTGDEEWVQLALVSFGVPDDTMIEWDINTKVATYVDSGWFREVMGDDLDEVCVVEWSDEYHKDNFEKVVDNGLKFRFHGGKHSAGIVLAEALSEDNYLSNGAICDDGVGRHVIRMICHQLGFRYGQRVDCKDLMYDYDDMPRFAISDITCPIGADKTTSDCHWSRPAGNESVPCMSGDFLAVSCSKSAFSFDMKLTAKIRKNGMARYIVKLELIKYGMSQDLKMDAEVSVYNRHQNGTFTQLGEPAHKPRKDFWRGKGDVSGVAVADRCLVGIATLRFSDHMAVSVGACAYDISDEKALESFLEWELDNY